MPRIVTIVGASAPTVETFVATTIVREPRFYVRQLSTGAGFGLIPKDRYRRRYRCDVRRNCRYERSAPSAPGSLALATQ